MTLATLHARFLQHCAVEKRLRPMTIKSYRSDFGLFLGFIRRRSQALSPKGAPTLRTFTTTLIRDYQAHMATRRWSVNTVRRRLVELNRFAGWLVERRDLARSPMIGVAVPRREHRLPGVLGAAAPGAKSCRSGSPPDGHPAARPPPLQLLLGGFVSQKLSPRIPGRTPRLRWR